LVFGLTVYLSFPYDLIGEKGVKLFESRTGAKLSFETLSPSFVTGLGASGVRLTLPPGANKAEGLSFDLGEVGVRVRLLSTMMGSPSVSFNLAGELAKLSGSVTQRGEEGFDATVQLEELDLGQLGSVWDSLGLAFSGKVSGGSTLTLPRDNPVAFSGDLHLSFSDAAFGGGMVKGFSVPSVSLGNFELGAAAAKGRLEFAPSLVIDSKDLGAEVTGSIDLKPVLATSFAKLELKFKLQEAFIKANSALASIATGMLASGKGSDAYYHYSLSGRVGRPTFLPIRGK